MADVEIYSDASLSGWGASCNEVTTRVPWTSSDASCHINELELLGAFFTLQAFVGSSRDIAVRLFIDNTTAICYINKSSGTRSKRLSDLANCFSLFCEERKLSVKAVHLPGVRNVVADKESLTSDDSSDWRLSFTCFKRIGRIWPLRIDLFSSAWNAQLPAFGLCHRNRILSGEDSDEEIGGDDTDRLHEEELIRQIKAGHMPTEQDGEGSIDFQTFLQGVVCAAQSLQLLSWMHWKRQG